MTIGVTGWRTSSFSGSQGGNCVEVAGQDRRVLVRDAKQAGQARCSGSPPRPGTGSLTRLSARDGLTAARSSR